MSFASHLPIPVFTLLLAIVLVLVVVYLFVQDFRATLIPALGIIVSLIGTFAFMAVAGFSVNMLTLFALTLAPALCAMILKPRKE